jgi:hypothetical protein
MELGPLGTYLALFLGSLVAFPTTANAEEASWALTAEEEALVQRLASEALTNSKLLVGKTYLTRIELFSGARGQGRNVLVEHYRYQGDVTLQTSIDLDKRQVLGTIALEHSPTPLAAEELERAEQLARAHPLVKRALARYADKKIEVDALLVFTADAEQPSYHHRAVRLHFREGRSYLLYAPHVEIDLTTETARAQANDKAHKN